MILENSEVKITVNIGLCLKNQNLKKINELSGQALIRALSFIHYYLKQNENLKSVLDLNKDEIVSFSTTFTEPFSCFFSTDLSRHEKIKKMDNYLLKSYYRSTDILEVAQLYKIKETSRLLSIETVNVNTLSENMHSGINDYCAFIEFAKKWIHSINGLEFTAQKINALFNEDGEIYYDGKNPLLNEHNCPIIASLLN